jgi:CDP-diglyceride synthetase
MSAVVINIVADIIIIALGCQDIWGLFLTQAWVVLMAYMMLMVFSLMITFSEWRYIRASGFKKIFYSFTFPLFLFSFVPAAFVAMFKKVEWKQIDHKGSGQIVSSEEKTEEKAPSLK